MNTPYNTNVMREWGFGKCYAIAACGWMGRCHRHVKTCKACKHV